MVSEFYFINSFLSKVS
uniref:Uncharacterized protein n=1 Tax=Arundo donax TaxID=35708 RepID=A0A0A9FBH9_ARUDO